jgi:hypothetical protein
LLRKSFVGTSPNVKTGLDLAASTTDHPRGERLGRLDGEHSQVAAAAGSAQPGAGVAVSGEKSERELQRYRQRVKAGLDQAYKRAPEKEFDLDEDAMIVLSDHHRGARDGADDFWRCEGSYNAALGYYLEAGHHLFLLGDVEELWENRPKTAVDAYPGTLDLEREFHLAGRLERFWGNHDDTWRHKSSVDKFFSDRFPGLEIRESLRLHMLRGGKRIGELFLVHGHQGTSDSDRFAIFSKQFVRYGWRPLQRRFNIASTTPARDFELRATHDDSMFEWSRARPEKLVLIAGHTHRPVFGGTVPPPALHRELEVVEHDLEALRSRPNPSPEALAAVRAELEFVRTKPFGEPPRKLWPPCYYNTGCCSFGDGDVTGIEIADGKIRLIRWLNDEYKPVAKLLAEEDLDVVFEAVQARALVHPT